MGDLIVMSRAKPLPARAQIASAEILFFTGVRYYRMADDAGPKPTAVLACAKPTGKRRRHPEARRRMAEFAPPEAIEALV